MMAMIQTERLSPQAMQIVANAREEAKRSGNQLVGTEHVLLGIVRCGDDKLQEHLMQAGLTEELVRKTAHEVVPSTKQPHSRDDLDFTPRVQRLITKAFSEADSLNETLVQPRHILIAMMRDDYGIASRILERTQVNTTSLLKTLLK
jgi:ATP-dependent Clp protease ATP-binding subunit ClpC